MIICFSGTGNSAAVASRLSVLLDDESLVLLRGEILTGEKPALTLKGERIIWVFPTYSWGVPPVVADFIGRVEIAGADNVPHFMVTTCGDDIGRTDRIWQRLIGMRGWSTAGRWSVRMPNTYVCMKGFDVDSKRVEGEKLGAMPSRVADIAGAIIGRPDAVDVETGSWAWIKTKLIYPWFRRYAMSSKSFRVSDACIGCGACERGCPTENIRLNAGTKRPEWDDNCALCLHCYHYCPTNAIAYGKNTGGKGQYRCPDDAHVQG